MTVWEEFGKKRFKPNWGPNPEFARRDWEKLRRPQTRCLGWISNRTSLEYWIQALQNYCCSNLHCQNCAVNSAESGTE
jgi:hypothetical protein